MQVILREDISKLGKTGDLVTIKNGYGRNFLIPRGLAVHATPRSVRKLEHDKRVIAQQDARRRKDAQTIKEQLEALSITVAKKTGEDDKLFGSVTNRDISDAIKEAGFDIDRKAIKLDQNIKALGVYTVEVKLAGDLTANIKVWVVEQ